MTSYADDISPMTSNNDYKVSEKNLQPCLTSIYEWILQSDLQLNPTKSSATLFTPDPAEYRVALNLTINNHVIPTTKSQKFSESIRLQTNFNKHIKNTKEKDNKSLNLIQPLITKELGKVQTQL